MAARKKTRRGIWKKQLRQTSKRAFNASLKLAGALSGKVWYLLKLVWKAWIPYVTARGGKRTQAERIRLRTILVLGVMVGVVIAVIKGRQADPSCALREQVDSAFVQQYWADVRQWCSLIMRASETYHLDPYLIAAVILQESGGDPHAYSSYGAVGLMQVMPRDGLAASFSCPTGPCFAHRPAISELEDPAFNVNYGSQLLAANLAQTGSPREALRNYGPINAGYSYADAVLAVYDAIKP